MYCGYEEKKTDWLDLVRRNGNELKCIPTPFVTRQLCLEAVKNNGEAIEYVPRKFLTEDICMEAVKSDGLVLYRVPMAMRTRDVCMAAVKSKGWTINAVPSGLVTPEMCVEATKNDAAAFRCLEPSQITEDVCVELVRHDGMWLREVPEQLRTQRVVQVAMDNTEFYAILRFIPPQLMTDEISARIQTMYDNKGYVVVGTFVISLHKCLKEPCTAKHYVLQNDGTVRNMYSIDIFRLLKRNGLNHPHFTDYRPEFSG